MVSLSTHIQSSEKIFCCKKQTKGKKSFKLHFQPSRLSNITSLSSDDESCSTRSIADDPLLGKEARSDLVVVLDLDECLIHNSNRSKQFRGSSIATSSSESIESFCVNVNGHDYQVKKRPQLTTFLEYVCSRYAEVHIFTASMQVYADPIIDHLDPTGTMFTERWYRQHCHYQDKVYVKDLTVLDKPMDRIVLVDNNPYSFLANPDNGILVQDFYDNPEDTCLLNVLTLLDELDKSPDVRPLLQESVGPLLRETLCDKSHRRFVRLLSSFGLNNKTPE